MTGVDTDRLGAFFDAARDAFDRAASATGDAAARHVAIAGSAVHLRFTSTKLEAAVGRAFDHLPRAVVSAAAPPTLTVFVWDSESTGVAMPRPPWTAADRLPRRELRGATDGPIRAALGYEGVVELLDIERREAQYWFRDLAALPDYELASPMRTIVQWWFGARGVQMVHGAAVGAGRRGVILAGPGGAGKSTTALECVDAGLAYAGDDYCLVTPRPSPVVWSLYNSAKATPAAIRRWKRLAHAALDAAPVEDKQCVFLHPHAAENLAAAFDVTAIALPRITGVRETRVRPASRGEALKALAPSSVLGLGGAGQAAVTAMAELVRAVPAFHLDLGTEPAGIVAAVERLVTGA